MKRVKLTVAYDGTNYCGWQVQPNGLAVQEVLNRCLSEFLGTETEVIGASRTDAGVHALGNVAVFDTDARMPAEKFSYALNTRLPQDIRIQDSCQVPEDFHPRFQETIKTYEYKIYNRQFPDPTKRLYTYFYYYPLDVQKMRQGAGYLIGEHDFKSFSTYKPEVENTVRTIYELDIHRSEDNVITIRIRGNGFLYNMVRIIAGTLIRVGGGYYPPEHVKEILEGKNRELAGETARPEGLTLVEIRYPEWEAKKMDISYQWIRSRRKTIAIQIDRNGQVILRTPYGITKRQAEKFLDEKKDWILKNIRQVENRKTDQIMISEEQRREGIERAKRIFPERTAYFALRMGVDYGRITIREQKTRWGSCSSKGNLNFNWKLVLLAPELLDYVVVHELAHRREMNHSKDFWKIVEAELPDYRERRRRLKECRI